MSSDQTATKPWASLLECRIAGAFVFHRKMMVEGQERSTRNVTSDQREGEATSHETSQQPLACRM